MLSYTMTPKSLNICIDGSMFTIDQTHANYNAIREELKAYSNTYPPSRPAFAKRIKELCDIKKFIAMWTRGDVEVGADAVLYKGQPVSGVIATRLISMVSEGFSPEPLAAFLAKLQANPAEHARNELYLWLETSNLPICEDGDFLAFKSVRYDYLSHHDGVTNNSIGTILEMPREDVDPERDNTCSTGFHFCSMDYLYTYGGGSRIVILKINPADVVSIPSDYNNKKGRAWRYLVVDEVKSARVADYEFNGVSVAKADAVTGVGASDKYMASYPVDVSDDDGFREWDADDDEAMDLTFDGGVSDNDDENVQIFDEGYTFPDHAAIPTKPLVFDDSELVGRSDRYEAKKVGRGVRLTKGERTITLTELKAMLKEHGQRGTARLTGIPRTTIQEWITRYNLA